MGNCDTNGYYCAVLYKILLFLLVFLLSHCSFSLNHFLQPVPAGLRSLHGLATEVAAIVAASSGASVVLREPRVQTSSVTPMSTHWTPMHHGGHGLVAQGAKR